MNYRPWYLRKPSLRPSELLAPPRSLVLSVLATREPVKSSMSSQSWVTIESSMDGSRFSDVMSDEVTIEQQRKEELAAMVPPSEGSVVSGNSRRTEQWVDETCRERTNEVEEGLPNSNLINELAAEEGTSPM